MDHVKDLDERVRDLEEMVTRLQESLLSTLGALKESRDRSTELVYEVFAVRYVLQLVAAASFKTLGAASVDVSDISKSAVRNLGAMTLPGVDRTDSTIAMSEIVEIVDEIFAKIEGLVAPLRNGA